MPAAQNPQPKPQAAALESAAKRRRHASDSAPGSCVHGSLPAVGASHRGRPGSGGGSRATEAHRSLILLFICCWIAYYTQTLEWELILGCPLPPHHRILLLSCFLCRLELWRDQHIEYLTRGLRHLGPAFHVLDANRPWLCYWMVHPLALLDEALDDDLENDIIDFLARCQDKDGGYSGGPGQLPHLATTYAAVNTLVTIGSERALSSINRDNLYKFMFRMKDVSGAFRMHDGGEIDVRASYTAISVASLVNILDVELAKGVGDFIASCQTYEGGIAGEPYAEAHGGYTFCGLAALILLNEAEKVDLPSLIGWVAFRQGVECGFQGRTNKLVDGCYSFWQGAAIALTQKLITIVDKQLKSSYSCKRPSGEDACSTSSYGCTAKKFSSAVDYAKFGFDFIQQSNQIGPLFHNIALQQYILLCSQVLEGGLRDKPGKNRDHYHSCYCLSGLSVSQYSAMTDADSCPLPQHVLGPYSNLLDPIHPLYNVVLDKYHTAYEFFSKE